MPHHWQLNSVFDNQRNEFIKNVLQNLRTYGKSTKSFYHYLFLKIDSSTNKLQTCWNRELNLSLGTEDWSIIYKCIYEVTSETKLKSFQIKVYMRAVATNIILHGLEIITTDKCTFYNSRTETFSHLLCTFIKVTSFWDNINFSGWIESKLKCILDFKPFNVLFYRVVENAKKLKNELLEKNKINYQDTEKKVQLYCDDITR